jgi:hypothetical protein
MVKAHPATYDRIITEAPKRLIERIGALMERAKLSRAGLAAPVTLQDLDARTIFASELKELGYSNFEPLQPKSAKPDPSSSAKPAPSSSTKPGVKTREQMLREMGMK